MRNNNMEQKDLERLNKVVVINIVTKKIENDTITIGLKEYFDLTNKLDEISERNEHLIQIVADMSKMSVERLKKVFKYDEE